ncbi:MAG: hypothetical protein U0U67_13350 [Chitinophagales bacterium]
MQKVNNNFFRTIHQLREYEELILFTDKHAVSAIEERAVIDYLAKQYQSETVNYPFVPPAFNATAALWSAKLIYHTAFFFLCRNDNTSKLISVLKEYNKTPDVSEHLSADLLMRFLPHVYSELKATDAQDTILPILEAHMQKFHYSSIGTDIEIVEDDLTELFKNACFRQLYIDRVTAKKVQKLITIPQIRDAIKENLGDYTQVFWHGF